MLKNIFAVFIFMISLYGCRDAPGEPEVQPVILEWIYFHKLSLRTYPDYLNRDTTMQRLNPVPIYDNTAFLGDTIIICYNYEYGNLPEGEMKYIDKPVIIRLESKTGDYEDYVLKKSTDFLYIVTDVDIRVHLSLINYFPFPGYTKKINNGFLTVQTPIDTLLATYNSPYQNLTRQVKLILKEKN